jgi:putative ABC transport system ATP-binding protein
MEKLMAHFRELNRVHKVTFLIATHDQRVMEWAERRIGMEDGRVIRDELQQAV